MWTLSPRIARRGRTEKREERDRRQLRPRMTRRRRLHGSAHPDHRLHGLSRLGQDVHHPLAPAAAAQRLQGRAPQERVRRCRGQARPVPVATRVAERRPQWTASSRGSRRWPPSARSSTGACAPAFPSTATRLTTAQVLRAHRAHEARAPRDPRRVQARPHHHRNLVRGRRVAVLANALSTATGAAPSPRRSCCRSASSRARRPATSRWTPSSPSSTARTSRATTTRVPRPACRRSLAMSSCSYVPVYILATHADAHYAE